ncbi:MAG: aminoacetone oxidase family FAD-binding enzyme, partial [bacterium]|nr:aminoacetone oxidase family FAD-binding enzyme [bacterium]
MSCDVIILGAGAAGLMTAIAAQEQGKKILILESNEKAGRKIIISGGGRCNFTNTHVTPEDYVSQNSHFCKSALAQFAPEDFIRLVKSAEISFYEKTLGQLFCEKSSAEILNMLLCKIDSPDCEIRTEVQIRSVQFSDGLFVVTSDGETFQGKNLVVATGGLSYPSLGASDLGYRLARQFGHKDTELWPALDGIV